MRAACLAQHTWLWLSCAVWLHPLTVILRQTFTVVYASTLMNLQHDLSALLVDALHEASLAQKKGRS
jgi:hypothetical protein